MFRFTLATISLCLGTAAHAAIDDLELKADGHVISFVNVAPFARTPFEMHVGDQVADVDTDHDYLVYVTSSGKVYATYVGEGRPTAAIASPRLIATIENHNLSAYRLNIQLHPVSRDVEIIGWDQSERSMAVAQISRAHLVAMLNRTCVISLASFRAKPTQVISTRYRSTADRLMDALDEADQEPE